MSLKTWVDSRVVRRVIVNDIMSAIMPTWLSRLMLGGEPIESNSQAETYSDLSTAPVFREWLGERKAHELSDLELIVRNKKFEATMDIPRDWLRFEKINLIDSRIASFPLRAIQHWLTLLFGLIKDGATQRCIDGQYFFDTDHPVGKTASTYSNKIDCDISTYPVATHGSTTAPSVAEAAVAIGKGITQLMGIPDDQGQPMMDMVEEFLVVCPLTLEEPLGAAVSGNSLPVTDGAIEGLRSRKKRITVVGSPRLSDWTDKFAIFALGVPQAPFICQQVGEVEATAKAEGSDYEHDTDHHQYGVMHMRAAAYGAPQCACLVTLI